MHTLQFWLVVFLSIPMVLEVRVIERHRTTHLLARALPRGVLAHCVRVAGHGARLRHRTERAYMVLILLLVEAFLLS
jgi:hypothetical protein